MRWAAMALAFVLVSWSASLMAQTAPTERFQINAHIASTWTQGNTSVIQLTGPVTIQLDNASLSADEAVIWLTPEPGTVIPHQQATIALIGHARLKQTGITRTGDELLVTTVARDGISLMADQRLAQDLTDTLLYRRGLALRRTGAPPPPPAHTAAPPPPPATRPHPATAPAPASRPAPPVTLRFGGTLQQTQTPQGKVAVVIDGGILLLQKRPDGDFLELRADRVVLFTTLDSLREAGAARIQRLQDAIAAVYLEGDVRIEYTPHDTTRGPQRLQADRVYYDLANDRAILTDAVVHSVEPTLQIPIILRAQNVRQLDVGQYNAHKAQLTTSAFATPTYSLAASDIYVRQSDTGDPRLGTRTTFTAHDATFNVLDLPIFYFPLVGGSVTEQGFPLRQAAITNSSRFGLGVETTWGVLEALGLAKPRGFDLAGHLDYFGDRGPALGLDGKYNGGFITQTTKDPWNFQGGFHTYFVHDTGFDDLGRGRADPDRTIRGQFLWEHQHFFPDDWQMQLRAGYVTDPTFLEEWFPNQFDNGLPHDLSFYVKRQHDTEATTFLLNAQPRDFVTTADALQEQFEVEHLPEFGYHRIGDSFADDNFTLFSDNTLSRLRFHTSNVPLTAQGFPPGLTPGLPSLGTTGVTDSAVYRANLRQEINYPASLGPIRLVPYIEGIYTGYTDAPNGGWQNRLYSGVGLRATTAFWKVDDSAQSDLLDIHRLRHVIEPELNLFTSGTTVERSDVFVFDEPTDAISDISAMQLALHQRWQTKRGGPGRWRSVDWITWNLQANLFANQPPDALLEPLGFRGLYFPTLPETSIPRNSLNTDATWRISDTTALLGDVQYNLDESDLATAAIGLAVRRDPRLSYYLGTRYINQLNSNIATFAVDYQLTKKYTLAFSQSFDFSQQDNVASSITMTRKFDRFFVAVRVYHNSTDDTSGITFNLIPEGLPGQILNSVQGVFAGR